MARERPVSCTRCCDALSGPSFSSVFSMGSIGLRRLQELRLLLCLVLLVTTAVTRKRPQKKKLQLRILHADPALALRLPLLLLLFCWGRAFS
ncbi:uncharacterized protein IWZ02DRAFT_440196 [Phyllosticta citriasiana]|uniref:uncharacterized protein n=1 Tax=Phyllosticta citriasiana TaxID=595635 RepID=UPI0030FD9F35